MSVHWPDISFQDRMASSEFRVHDRAHIVVNSDSCNGCTTRACVVACPANLFVPTADGGIVFNYEQCFECGTCYRTDGQVHQTVGIRFGLLHFLELRRSS